MTLDQRAREAAQGLRDSVAGHPLLLMSPTPRRTLMPRVLSLAGAAAVVLFAGLAVFQIGLFAPDQSTTDPTPVTTTPTTLASTSTLDGTTSVPEAPPSTTSGSIPATPSVETTPTSSLPEAVDTEPPSLEIVTPRDGEHFEKEALLFAGTTEPGASVTAGPYAADVDPEGHWSIVLMLSPGGNRATITASDSAGNTSEASVLVYLDVPETTTTTTKPEEKPPSVEFTAHARYGSCEQNPPYDEYYGTAEPGTKIRISSDYGSGYAYAGDSGEWSVIVEFPEAPKEKGFVVTVKNETTYEKYQFEFTSYAP